MSWIALIPILVVGLSSFAGAKVTNLKTLPEKRLFIRKNPNQKITRPGSYTGTLKDGGHDRYYLVHIPAKYRPSVPTPLVFILHGGGGNMRYQANDEYYKLITKSEKAGFIAVFPNGFTKLSSGKLATWNAGKCCGDSRDQKIDEVGFLKKTFEAVKKELNIDEKKVFSIGMSNGGMMSYRLACEAPNIFKGIAAVAGTDNTINCDPSTPTNILHIHAKDDSIVKFDGGIGKDVPDPTQVNDFTSVATTIAKWVKINGCVQTPKRVLQQQGAYCDLYSGCKNDVKVQLCVTETGGHSWPGGKKASESRPINQGITANDVIWDFFTQKSVK